MSLLMDALKRAEQAKRQQAAEGAPTNAGSLQLEPVIAGQSDARVSPLPDLNSHLDSVEADLKATAAEHPERRKANTQQVDHSIDRAAAQNVFAAGAGSISVRRSDGAGSRRIIAIISLGVLAAAGIGGYFYWQLQGLAQGGNRLAGPGLATVTHPPLAAAPPAPLPITATAAPAANVGGPSSAPPSAIAIASKPVAPAAGTAGSGGDQTRPRLAATQPHRPAMTIGGKPAPTTGAAASLAAPAAADGSTATLRISSQSLESPVFRGYEALQAGRFADAKAAYAQALRADSRDTDALLGLATLAQREGQSGSAADYYDRVLQNDPRNATAYAGMMALQGGNDPSQTESRLKSLLNQSQNSQNTDGNATSALNFALGNLYAGQRRWSEAQQAYFRSHTADAGNADTLYNLAISLEHLNQPALARQFYAQAIQAGRQRAATFDRSQAEQRLAALPH